MSIKVWDYMKEYQNEREETLKAVEDVFDSGLLVFGKNLKSFEEEFSTYCDSNYGVGVGCGTDALILAMRALGIGQDDNVITVSNTAIPTVSAIVTRGAEPVFADIDPDTYLMDLDHVEELIERNPYVSAVVAVHLFGQTLDMDRLNKMCLKNGIMVIEDCAQAHGATYKGRKAGSLGHLGAFSFYPTKILGTYGDGGFITVDSETDYDELMRLRFYGIEGYGKPVVTRKYYASTHGYNSRLDEIHAAILRKKLTHIDEYINRRQELAKRYEVGLKDTSYVLPVTAKHNVHAYYIYVVRHRERNRIVQELKDRDIFVNISYPYPIHLMDGYSNLNYSEGELPHTELAAKQIFSLPMYPTLTNEEQDEVIKVLKEID